MNIFIKYLKFKKNNLSDAIYLRRDRERRWSVDWKEGWREDDSQFKETKLMAGETSQEKLLYFLSFTSYHFFLASCLKKWCIYSCIVHTSMMSGDPLILIICNLWIPVLPWAHSETGACIAPVNKQSCCLSGGEGDWPDQSGALSLVEIVETLCSNWLKL